MQKLFSREIRFKDENGNDYPEWSEKALGDIFDERIEKGYTEYELLSVTIEISQIIFKHIEENGIIVAPMITDANQVLTKFIKKNNKLNSKKISDVLFVPNISGVKN